MKSALIIALAVVALIVNAIVHAQTASFYGTISAVDGDKFTMVGKAGQVMHVDATAAAASGMAVVRYAGENVLVMGEIVNGVIIARGVIRAKLPSTWPE